MRLMEIVQGLQVVVLVDSGSTHYFINPMVAKKTKLKASVTKPLGVKIANGELIQTVRYYYELPLRFIRYFFYLYIY